MVPTLPDRNPLRAAPAVAPIAEPTPPVAQDAPPSQAAAQDSTPAPEPSIASDATTQTGTVPTPDRNPTATPADALPLP
ncbi:MAG: hypothetical protein ACXWVQ_08755, partial [Methyloceanibacter sp.]